VIASFLVFLPLPLLIGIFATVQGMIASYAVIAASTSTPKPSEVASGISTALFTVLIGLAVSFPAYLVLAFGLFLRTLASPGRAHKSPS
jgi:biopolymer transport protein ExbB/TolQ